MDMPGGGHMTRLACGTTTIKIVVNAREPRATSAPGGIGGSTGYRYFTISVSNLKAATQECSDAGYKVVVEPTEIRAGITISIIEDPDGNWGELLTNGRRLILKGEEGREIALASTHHVTPDAMRCVVPLCWSGAYISQVGPGPAQRASAKVGTGFAPGRTKERT